MREKEEEGEREREREREREWRKREKEEKNVEKNVLVANWKNQGGERPDELNISSI